MHPQSVWPQIGNGRILRLTHIGLAAITWCMTCAGAANDTSSGKTAASSASLSAQQASNVVDLVSCFRKEQAFFRRLMPPDADHTLTQPCGLVVFDSKAFPKAFNDGLIGEMEYDCPVYKVIVAEDPATREIVFANADGREIYAVQPETGYDPYWLLNLFYPSLYAEDSSDDLLKGYDSARIQIVFTLIPGNYADKYAKALANAALSVGSPPPGGVILMRYSGPPVTNLTFAAIERQTNNMLLTVVYPSDYTNRLDLFVTDELIGSWWDRLATTNIDVSTNWIEWLDTTATNASVRFYAVGNADLDTDNDGFTDAAEKFMYHTSATTNDTDGDTITDYYEVMTLGTDPNNPKTNKPNVWISYPANESRKVWLP